MTRAETGTEAGVRFDETFDAVTLPIVRQRVAACTAAAGIAGDRAADVTLAVHELAANTVRHGSGSGRLAILAVNGLLRCQVSEAGPGPSGWPGQPGHGLWILKKVADEVTASSGPQGSQVTAVFRPAGPRRDLLDPRVAWSARPGPTALA